jgi:hypothetical protein
MSRISFAVLVAGTALALGAPMASAADAPEIDRALGYTKFFSDHCLAPTHVAERPIGAGLSQVNGLFACDTMLLIMFAHHPGLMMVQFMVKGSDPSQILGSQVTSGRIRGGGSCIPDIRSWIYQRAFRPCRRLPGLRAVDAESVLSRDRLAAIQPKATVTDLLAKARGLVKVVVDDGRPAKQNTHPGLRPDFTLPVDCIGIAHGLDDHGLHAVLRRLLCFQKKVRDDRADHVRVRPVRRAPARRADIEDRLAEGDAKSRSDPQPILELNQLGECPAFKIAVHRHQMAGSSTGMQIRP